MVSSQRPEFTLRHPYVVPTLVLLLSLHGSHIVTSLASESPSLNKVKTLDPRSERSGIREGTLRGKEDGQYNRILIHVVA